MRSTDVPDRAGRRPCPHLPLKLVDLFSVLLLQLPQPLCDFIGSKERLVPAFAQLSNRRLQSHGPSSRQGPFSKYLQMHTGLWLFRKLA